MALDEALKQARSGHRQIRIDNKDQFVSELEQRIFKPTITKKRKWAIVIGALVVIPLMVSSAVAEVSNWSMTWKGNVTATNGENLTPSITAYWKFSYLHSSLPRKILNMQKAREAVSYQIYQPQTVPGWTRVFAGGFFQLQRFHYLDVFQNGQGERVSVLQERSIVNQSHVHYIFEYPHNANVLTNFRPDLAVFFSGVVYDGKATNTRTNELDVYQKNTDNTMTEFMLSGEISKQELERIADVYLHVPKS